PEYEARLHHKETQLPALHQPVWDSSALGKRTLLIHAEQGLGDTLQFVRFLPLIKQRFGGSLILECQETLSDLLADFPGADRVIPQGEPLPQFDVHMPLL